MAAKQHVNNSGLYQTLCIYDVFDHWNLIIITSSKFCQRFISFIGFFCLFCFVLSTVCMLLHEVCCDVYTVTQSLL